MPDGEQEPGLDQRVVDQLGVIRLDYEQSLRFIDGVVRISSTIRQTTMTAGVALIGLSIQNKSPALALAAVALGLLMGLYDAYHGWLYSRALERVTAMEGILRAEKSAYARIDDEAVVTRLEELVDDFRVGPLTNLPRFGPTSLLEARPRLMYTIYPLTVAAGIAAAHYCK